MQFTITVTDVDGHSTTTLRTAQQIERDETVASLLSKAQHGSVAIAVV